MRIIVGESQNFMVGVQTRGELELTTISQLAGFSEVMRWRNAPADKITIKLDDGSSIGRIVSSETTADGI